MRGKPAHIPGRELRSGVDESEGMGLEGMGTTSSSELGGRGECSLLRFCPARSECWLLELCLMFGRTGAIGCVFRCSSS